jgi:hypothetical protein
MFAQQLTFNKFMDSGNIRTPALTWFNSNYPNETEAVFSSKFYKPAESWSNSRVWFFQIPFDVLNPKKIRFIHLLCQNHLKGDPFLYLKVPVSFMLLNEKAFEVDHKQKLFRIYLSAEAVDMFREIRKGSKLDFTKYVQNLQSS